MEQDAFREGARDRAILRTLAMISIPYALDALNFFAADARNALGPFVNVYLVTERHWSQTEVGLVATASGLLGIALQTPIGAAIDLTPPSGASSSCRSRRWPSLRSSSSAFRPSGRWRSRSRSGDRGRRLCACGRRADPRRHAQIRPCPASRPELGVRSCRQHRDCHRGGRGRLRLFAARGLPDGSGLRRLDHGGCAQHSRERHQSGPRERCGR